MKKSIKKQEAEAASLERKKKFNEMLTERFCVEQVEVLKFIDEDIELIVPANVYSADRRYIFTHSLINRIIEVFRLAKVGKKFEESDLGKENIELNREISRLNEKFAYLKEVVGDL